METGRETCLTVSGKDRIAFLQGQLTQDIARLAEAAVLPAAWCNPKGRVIALLTLVQGAAAIHVFLPEWQAEDFRTRLLRYRLRSDVDIEPTPALRRIAIGTGSDGIESGAGLPVIAAREIPGTEPTVTELFGDTDALEEIAASVPLSETQWELACLRAGRPALPQAAVEQYTPHMLNLDLLGAISFTKGCYTGQEVVARTENLGRPSRRMLRFAVSNTPAPGSSVKDGADTVAGTVIRSAPTADGGEFLAVVSLKKLDGDLYLETGESVEQRPLPYSVPELDGD